MRILWKKLLRSNWRRKLSTCCSPRRVDSASVYFPLQCDRRPESTDAGSKLLLRQYFEQSGKYEYCNFSPENSSSEIFCSSENPWLVRYEEIAPSCNGLLYVYNKSGEAAIWNPSTEEAIELPWHRKAESSSVYGSALGFDSKSGEYKVVRFVDRYKEKGDEDGGMGVELYSFKSNSWKWISEMVCDLYSPCVYVKGCAYWLCKEFILKLELGDESFCCIDLPPSGKLIEDGRWLFELDIVEFDGSLGAIVHSDVDYFGSRKSFEVWVWAGGVWSKQVTVPPCRGKRPMGLWRNSQFFLETYFKTWRGGVAVYDLRTKEVREHVIQCASGYDYDNDNDNDNDSIVNGGGMKSIEFIPYVETMLPIQDQLQLNTSLTGHITK